MNRKTQTIMTLILQLILFTHYMDSALSLSLSQQVVHNFRVSAKSSLSGSRQSRQILPTNAILLPNVGQYLALIQILVLKLVIWTQIMRLFGLAYVGKGIKSSVPLSEQQEFGEILDYEDSEDSEAEPSLRQQNKKKKKRRRKRTTHTLETRTTFVRIIKKMEKLYEKISEKFTKIIKFKEQNKTLKKINEFFK